MALLEYDLISTTPRGAVTGDWTMVNSNSEARQSWSAPRLEELGNLRTLVKAAQNKSQPEMDSTGGCEGMFGLRCSPSM